MHAVAATPSARVRTSKLCQKGINCYRCTEAAGNAFLCRLVQILQRGYSHNKRGRVFADGSALQKFVNSK